MVLTLLIIFVSVVSRMVLDDTVTDLRNKVDMSIYLKTETNDQAGADLSVELEKLPSVVSVKYISADDARKQIIAETDNQSELDAITEATNKNPATLRVVVQDINETKELEDFVANNTIVKEYLSSDYEPSFAGERRGIIQSIGRAVKFAQNVGIGMGLLFVIISSLIIFNTIRMAIFNRKEEIQMMKLIGADKSFIRGPFLVESTIYGFIAAFFATGLGLWGLYSSADLLTSYQIIIEPTIKLVSSYVWLILPIMIVIGALIGVISSLFATRKHLKI
jgi:cell division transport system permease protein